MRVPNDGSVVGDSCQCCDGKLMLQGMPNGSSFLACTNYYKTGCRFTMAPNPAETLRLNEEKAKKRANKKWQEEEVPCEACGEVLTTVRKYQRLKTCARCAA